MGTYQVSIYIIHLLRRHTLQGPCVFGNVLTLKSLPFDHASILSSGTQDVSHNALEI